jgi:hypothetical protein
LYINVRMTKYSVECNGHLDQTTRLSREAAEE